MERFREDPAAFVYRTRATRLSAADYRRLARRAETGRVIEVSKEEKELLRDIGRAIPFGSVKVTLLPRHRANPAWEGLRERLRLAL